MYRNLYSTIPLIIILVITFFGISLPIGMMFTIVPCVIILTCTRKDFFLNKNLPLHIILLLIFIYEIINPYFSINRDIAIYTGLFIPASIIVFCFFSLVITSKNIDVVYYLFSSLLLVASLIIIFSFLIYVAIIKDGGWEIEEIIPLRYLFTPKGMLINDWGLLLLLLIPFPILLLRRIPSRYKLIPLAVFLVGIYASLLTFSRGTYLSIIIFMTLVIMFSMLYKVKLLNISAKQTIVLVIFFLIALIPIREPLIKMIPVHKESSISQQLSVNGRFEQWKRSFEIVERNPIFGVGTNGFRQLSKIISNQEESPYTVKVTNSYLQVLVEKGITGFLLYLALISYVGYLLILIARRKNKNNISDMVIFIPLFIGIAVKELTFSSLFDNEFIFLTFIIWIALLNTYAEKETQVKPYRSFLLFIVIIYSLTFYRYYKIRTSIVLNEKSVSMSFLDNIEKANIELSEIDTAHIKSPVIFSNQALIKVFKKDSLNFNAFAKGCNTFHTSDSQRIDTIIHLISQALVSAPKEPLFLLNLGWLYCTKGEYQQAIKTLKEANEISPQNSNILLSLGLISEFKGLKNNAIEFYSKSLASSPFIVESLFFKELEQRKPNWALESVNNAINILNKKKDNIIDQSKLSKLYLHINLLPQSKEILINITDILPNLNRSWLTLGDIYLKENDLDKAEICYQKAHLLDKGDKLVLCRLYTIYSMKNKKEYQDHYKKIINQTKSSPYTSNYFKAVYSYSHIVQDKFPYNAQEYFSPIIELDSIGLK